MSAVLTGPQRGTVSVMLPSGADEEFAQGLIGAIWQLDHVGSVDVRGRLISVRNDLVPHLSGQALVDTLVEFDYEITSVLNGMIALVEQSTKQAARRMVFSNR